MTDFSLIYITAKTKAEARAIARTLLSEHLIACANIIDHVESLYRWNGTIEEEAEVVIIAKTKREHVQAIVDRIRALSSYECPCIVDIPILGGNHQYMKWIEGELMGENYVK